MRGCVVWEGWVVGCVCTVKPGGIVGIDVVGCGGIDALGEVVPGAVPGTMGLVGSMVGEVGVEFDIGVSRNGDDGGGVGELGVCRSGEKVGVCMMKRLGVSCG